MGRRILAITKIFPNAVFPLDAPYIRQQSAHLQRHAAVEVLATIPWYPGARLFKTRSQAGRLTGVPPFEQIDGLPVRHPRYLLIPRVGLPLQGAVYAAALLPAVARYRGRVDVILATWAYPDGVAAILLGELLRVPVVVQVIGSDVNVVAQRPSARFILRRLLPRAAGVLAVSRQLAREVAALGVPEERIHVHPTGVDRTTFRPRDRAAARAQLGLRPAGPLLAFVGRLAPEKGVIDLLDAVEVLARERPEVSLAIMGAGPSRASIAERASRSEGRVTLFEERPPSEVATLLAASDLLALPSWAEGTPNVVLEALACGRRVVASRVGGIPDVLGSEELGTLVAPRDVPALAVALKEALTRLPYDAEAVSRAAPVMDWAQHAESVWRTLEGVIGGE